MNTFFSNSNSNARCVSSSNVFLSKSANNSRDRFDRFSTNRMNNYTNVFSTTTTTTTNATNVQTNIFKKMGDNNHCFNQIPAVTTTSTSMQIVEINNETFPSLTSTPPVAAATTTSSVPKKFKNFKDAICAAAPALSASPTKQKQARVLPTSAIPPPVVVKRDSEMYAKKMLAKTKIISAVYGDDDDDEDGDGDDENRVFRCSRNSKPMFMNNYGNDSD